MELSREERAVLGSEIRLAFIYQRVQWSAMATGVNLGVEEVQDRRIAALETPAEPTEDDALIAALEIAVMTALFLLDAPVVIPIVAAANQGFRAFVRSRLTLSARAYRNLVAIEGAAISQLNTAARTAAARVAKAQRRGLRVQDANLGRRKRAEIAAESAERALKELSTAQRKASIAGRDRRVAVAVVQALQTVRSANVPEYLVAGLKVTLPNLVTSPGLATSPSGGQVRVSPGVSLRAMVEKNAAAAVQDLFWIEELYLRDMHTDSLTTDRAVELYEDIGEIEPCDTSRLIDTCQILAAALVWANLLIPETLLAGRMSEQDRLLRSGQQLVHPKVPMNQRRQYEKFDVVPEKQRAYFVQRFGPAAVSWAKANHAEVLAPHGSYPPTRSGAEKDRFVSDAARGVDTGASQPEILDLIVQWLDALRKESDLLSAQRTPGV